MTEFRSPLGDDDEDTQFPSPPHAGEARSGSPERLSEANAAGSPRDGSEAKGACSGITPPDGSKSDQTESAQTPSPPPPENLIGEAVYSIDCLEISGLVEWDTDHDETLRMVQLLQAKAREHCIPECYALAGEGVLIRPGGMGSGRQSHKEFVIELEGCLFAFSLRKAEKRRLSNFYVNIMGERCVTHGALETKALVEQMLAELGGTLFDSWVGRIDLALDVPGLDIRDWPLQTHLAGQFRCTAGKWNPWDGKQGKNAFTISGAGCRLNVYDKVLQTFTRKPELYQLAMIVHRWHGQRPQAATRFEYQLRKNWLDQFLGLATAESVLEQIPEILAKLLNTERHPFYCVTDAVPDRKNKNQSKVGVHPEWQRIADTFQFRAGQPHQPLIRRKSQPLSHFAAFRRVLSALVTAAGLDGYVLATINDLFSALYRLVELNNCTDEEIRERSEKKVCELKTKFRAQPWKYTEPPKGDKPCS